MVLDDIRIHKRITCKAESSCYIFLATSVSLYCSFILLQTQPRLLPTATAIYSGCSGGHQIGSLTGALHLRYGWRGARVDSGWRY